MIEKVLLVPIQGEKALYDQSAERGSTRTALVALTQLMILHLASRDLIQYFEEGAEYRLLPPVVFLFPLVLSFGGFLPGRLFSWAFSAARWITLAAVVVKFVDFFPGNANHSYLEMLIILFLTLTNFDNKDQQLTTLAALRWLPIIVLLWSGLQKILYGTYFNGSFLAYYYAVKPTFTSFFDLWLPAQELLNLSAQEKPGPFRFTTLVGLVMTNLVYITELLAGILFLIPRTRWLALFLAMGVLIGIESGAREIIFGLDMFYLLLLFLDGRWIARLRWTAVFIYGYLILASAGYVPGGEFN